MKVKMLITKGTAASVASHIWDYWLVVCDDWNGPSFRALPCGGFRFTTCCGNRWSLFLEDGQWSLEFSGSRNGWRSYLSAFGAEPVQGKPHMARIAGKFLAVIADVESSGGEHGRDPWLWGWEVTQKCREDEALLAPVLPWEYLPSRTSFAKAA